MDQSELLMSEQSQDENTQSTGENKASSRTAGLRPWKPGQSGNPGGRPKKKPVTDLYEQILNDPEAVDELREAIRKAIRKGNMAMVLQVKEMTDKVEGKVTQTIDATLDVN